jgi:hypothetical protein
MKDAWQPIDTAPRDARVLLFWPTFWTGKQRIEAGHWEADQYAKRPKPYWSGDQERIFGIRAYREQGPTHWQPLQAPAGVPRLDEPQQEKPHG